MTRTMDSGFGFRSRVRGRPSPNTRSTVPQTLSEGTVVIFKGDSDFGLLCLDTPSTIKKKKS